MPSWPNSLPDIELNGFSEKLQEGSIRTEVMSGAAFQRQRFSATVSTVGFSLTLNQAQYKTLIQFYKFDTAQGSLAFDFEHPVTDEECRARFVIGNPITANAIGNDQFRVSLKIEILPGDV